MGDPYSDLGNASAEMQKLIGDAMEARCSDPMQISMRRQYLGSLDLPDEARAVEFGSGTGHVTRDLLEVAGGRPRNHNRREALVMDAVDEGEKRLAQGIATILQPRALGRRVAVALQRIDLLGHAFIFPAHIAERCITRMQIIKLFAGYGLLVEKKSDHPGHVHLLSTDGFAYIYTY